MHRRRVLHTTTDNDDRQRQTPESKTILPPSCVGGSVIKCMSRHSLNCVFFFRHHTPLQSSSRYSSSDQHTVTSLLSHQSNCLRIVDGVLVHLAQQLGTLCQIMSKTRRYECSLNCMFVNIFSVKELYLYGIIWKAMS